MVNYPLNDKEFYEEMGGKKKEIEELDIPNSEKRNLYDLFRETIERYEEEKQYNLSEPFEKLERALIGLVEDVKEIGGVIQSLNNSLHTTKINLQLADGKNKTNQKRLNNLVIKGKAIDRKLTTSLILTGMKYQEKPKP